MARSRGHAQNPNQLLIVSLVLMVILCIALAGIAYSFWSGEADARADLLKEKELSTQRLNEQTRQKVLRAAWKILTGFDDKDDRTDLLSYQKNYPDELKAVKDKGDNFGTVWVRDAAAGIDLPKNPLGPELKKAKEDAAKALKARDDEKLAREKAETKLQEVQANCQKIENDYKKNIDELQEEAKKRYTKVNDEYKASGKKLEDALPDNAKDKETIKKLQEDYAKLDAQYKAEIEKNKQAVAQLKERIGIVDLLAKEQPKGKIFRLDSGGRIAYLDLGAKDYIKPGLTFSIFSPGKYRLSKYDDVKGDEDTRKGTLEVIRVVDDRSSEARITWTRNPVQDPILQGDLLYNPAWTPGQREHVAIAGIIDLTGDGRDNTQEFIRSLEKIGVIVDSYVDISKSPPARDSWPKGQNMTRERTSYLIIGEKPNLEQGAAGREQDPRMARRVEVRTEFDKLQQEAVSLGITTIPVRRYMALMGMKVPKLSHDDWTTYSLPRGNAPDGAAPARPDGAEKKEEMKKEEMKKEEK